MTFYIIIHVNIMFTLDAKWRRSPSVQPGGAGKPGRFFRKNLAA